MREQRKAGKVQVLGISIDLVRVDRAMNMTGHYLELDKFEYIVFINTAAAIKGQEMPEFMDFLTGAALALPGDKNIEDAIEGDLRIGEDESYQSEYFGRLFYKLNRIGASLYVVQDKAGAGKVEDRLKEHFEHIHLESSLWQEGEALAQMVNEINVIAPDVLLLLGDYEKIWDFLLEYGSKMNVRLCICTEELEAGEDLDVPGFLSALHLERLYLWVASRTKRVWTNSLFKKKMKELDMGQTEETSEEDES